MTDQREDQRGFTLIELMVAGTLGLILMIVVGGILTDTLRYADAISSRIALNRHAREIFDVLALGASNANANLNSGTGSDPSPGFRYVFGLRSRNGSSDVTAGPFALPRRMPHFMQRDANDLFSRRYRLVLGNGSTPPFGNDADGDPTDPAVATTERIPAMSVACTDTNTPLQGCAAGLTFTGVLGFLRADPIMSPATTANGVTAVAIQLMDPRPLGSSRSYLAGQTITYWMAFAALQRREPY
ncbi:prepilin-type N-terminal cleavage/methylation domain-containing protein [Azospirillum rugosum]|uniref:Prepilin-type N-terminal cleavage/methylation domain-containing protein n=1 Tax=Azospirillum rugosum TaxID=416170 RepID=A0ABS4SSC8_9PROT|nr:prepilin-type N-terminal cleavage/methylation domain-containing protein [Azospirillum rugosum]MBP2295469.1 prepilin-type N-terminal cleavage/methylation domain-containing protein [Azospirillum rugosum]MDQ0528348.1 prepilin-type N-terminal cleavage/methylation domain-containing protein [Azospirillum rugosum]